MQFKLNILLCKNSILLLYCFLTLSIQAQTTSNKFEGDLSNAGELDILDLIDMELETLMEINVVSVIDADENLRTASVQIFSEKDLLTNGFYNLADVLEAVAGLSPIQQGFVLGGEQRGIKGHFGSIVLLVNGRDVTNLYNYEAFISHQFSSHNIASIEIIQGPQGVNYGANAYSGVINIITKETLTEQEGVEVQTEVGSQGTTGISALIQQKIGKVSIGASARFFHTKGNDLSTAAQDSSRFAPGFSTFANGANRPDVTYANSGMAIPILFEAKYKEFYAGGQWYYNYSGNKGLQYVALDYNNANQDKRSVGSYYIGWDKRLRGKHFLSIEYQYRRERIWGNIARADVHPDYFNTLYVSEGRTTPLSTTEIQDSFTLRYDIAPSQNHRLRAYFNTFLSKDFCIHSGIMLEQNKLQNTDLVYQYPFPNKTLNTGGFGNIRPAAFKFTHYAAFLQLEKAFFNNQLIAVGGGRVSFNSNYKTQLTLKAGLIYHPTRDIYLKAFFNQGFKEPTIFQLASNNTEITNTLVPSRINNIELNYVQSFGKIFQINMSTFASWMHQSIIQDATSGIWQNAAENITIGGIETLFKYNLRRLKADVAYAFTQTSNRSNLYQHRWTTSLTYKIIPQLRVNARLSYFPAITDQQRIINGVSSVDIPASTKLNVTFSSKPIQLKDLSLQVTATVKNVWNATHWQPNIQSTGPAQFLQPNRQFIARVIFKYN